jgi:hypothetical protein
MKAIAIGILAAIVLSFEYYRYDNSRLELEITILESIKKAEEHGYYKGYLEGMEDTIKDYKLKTIKQKQK